jgi:hypothetical protein
MLDRVSANSGPRFISTASSPTCPAKSDGHTLGRPATGEQEEKVSEKADHKAAGQAEAQIKFCCGAAGCHLMLALLFGLYGWALSCFDHRS